MLLFVIVLLEKCQKNLANKPLLTISLIHFISVITNPRVNFAFFEFKTTYIVSAYHQSWAQTRLLLCCDNLKKKNLSPVTLPLTIGSKLHFDF